MGTSFLYTLRVEGYSERNPLDVGGLPVSYSFRLGVPQSLTQFVTPGYNERAVRDLGLFVQDQWRINRVTLSYGLRYDYNRAYAPAFTRPAGPLSAEQSFAATSCTPCWHDISPRFGVAWDVLATAGRRQSSASIATCRPRPPGWLGSSRRTARRSAAPRGSGSTPMGTSIPIAISASRASATSAGRWRSRRSARTSSRAFRSRLDYRMGKRPYTYAMSLSLDRQIATGLAIGGGFYRTWFGNFTIQDDLNLAGRLRSLLRHRADRSAARRQKRPEHLRLMQPQSGKVRPARQHAGDVHEREQPAHGAALRQPDGSLQGADVTIAARFQGSM